MCKKIDKMLQLKIISLAVCLHALIGASRGAGKYTDENRPYEFGFKIDGEQHRHEKKDENGIIMGEFGFITADGVYHVTVYATDENGRFKILSMKNIRVKPYPGSGGSMKKGHSLPFPSSGNVPTLQGPSKTSTSNQESKSTQTDKQISSPAKACSHCRLPTTTTKAPELTDIAVVARDHTVTSGLLNSDSYQSNPSSGSSRPDSFGQQIITPSGLGAQNTQSSISQNNSPHGHQPILSGQENHPKQEHDIGRSYQKQSAGNQLPVSYTKDYYPQQGTNSNVNNPQDGSSYYNKNENGLNQNIPQIVNSDVQAFTQNINNNNHFNPKGANNLNQNYPQTQNDAYQKSPQQQIEPNNYYSQPGSPFDQQLPRREVPDSNSQVRQGTLRAPKQYSNNNPSNSGLLQSPGFEAALASQGNQPISNKPTLLAAQMQIVPKDTDIYHKGPGEKDGLPGGLSKNDMTQLLYTFNYTVGFHGHHEEGYTNGAKQGYYFVTGRNGIRTRVDYIADEKGFRPRISHEVLDIASDDVPKPESEKDEKFGLKGYEFKWLYYPAEHRK